MDTIVYIDGYNLYYGVLKNTPYKWLDVVYLVKKICRIQHPNSNVIAVKYFTSPVKANFATNGEKAMQSQNNYMRALEIKYPVIFTKILGYHTVRQATPPRYKNPINKKDRVKVWKLEEKQTDVNIALEMYRDAAHSKCSQQVLVSSDTDLESALKYIKKDFSNIEIGLIKTSRTKPKNQNSSERNRGAKYLVQHSDWVRDYIQTNECLAAQLPEKIATNKKAIIKPGYW